MIRSLLTPTRMRLLKAIDRGHELVFTTQHVKAEATFPETFWARAAERITFMEPYEHVLPPDDLTHEANQVGQWFRGGKLNVAFNAVDRHAARQPQKVALYYDSPVTGVKRPVTYEELLHHVAAVATVLRDDFGVKKGDVVIVYMPNCPEAVFTMLACARLGAVHSCVFGGFSSKELSKRILDSKAAVVIASSCGIEGKKVLDYKKLVNAAIEALPQPHQVRHVGMFIRPQFPNPDMQPGRDVSMAELVQRALSRSLSSCRCVPVGSEDPFYILYTSGTTGMPKGIVRETGGMAVMLAHQMPHYLGVGKDETVFTASDIGWIVGTNFTVYAPLLHGCSSVLYEGKPVNTPDAGAFFRIVEEYRVKALFTAPTAFRAIKGADPDGELAKAYNLRSLHAIFLGGERTDPNTAEWMETTFGAPVVDTWWQTETGSPITSSPFDPSTKTLTRKWGCCGVACPGWNLAAIETDKVNHGEAGSGLTGELMAKLPLPPGALSGIWGRPGAVKDVYLRRPGYFTTFDAGSIDAETGLVSVMARTDDIINVAGHRLSTGQMEGVLCEHPDVAEAAVVGVHCDVKGEKPLGLVVIKANRPPPDPHALDQMVRQAVGPIAVIHVEIVKALPKTRSGKVLRRTIRQIAAKHPQLEVPATIEDPDVIGILWETMHHEPLHSH